MSVGGGAVDFSITGNSSSAIAQMQKVIAKQDEAIRGLQKMVRESRKGGKATKDATATAVTSLKRWALGYVGITQAINVTRQAFQSMLEERRRGAQELMLRERPLRALAQLAKGPADLRKMIESAKRTAVEEGITVPEAAAIQFRLVSAGERAQREQYAKLTRITAEPTEAGELATSAATFKKSFGAEAGATRQILAKLYAASEVSPAKVGEFGPAAARAAAAARSVKATDEELLAVLAVVGTALGTVDEAATATNRLLMSLLKKGITKGLMGGVQELQAMNLTAPELMKFLGKETGFKAYSVIMQNRPEIAGLIGGLQREDVAAMRGAPTALGRRLAAPEAIPELRIPELGRIAAERRKAAEVRAGLEEQRRKTAWDVVVRRSMDAGESGLTRFIRGHIWDIGSLLGTSANRLLSQQFTPDVLNLLPSFPPEKYGAARREIGEVGPAAELNENTRAVQELTATLKDARADKAGAFLPAADINAGGNE